MISSSRLRQAAAVVVPIALFLLSLLPAGSCGLGHSCTDIGCSGHGLDIRFDGTVAPGIPLNIEVALVEPGLHAPVPLINCVLSSSAGTDGGGEQLLCSSGLALSQSNPRTLSTHEIFQMVRVTIFSDDGTQLYQRTFTPSYTRSTPNGPDCGECVFGEIQVALPLIVRD
jgi:hypothetical protein